MVRIVKCLGHGCSIEATVDICAVDTRTVQRLLEKAGKRAEYFHRLQLEKLDEPLEAVQLDELRGKVVKDPKKTAAIRIQRRRNKRRVKKKAYLGSCGVGCNQPVSGRSSGGVRTLATARQFVASVAISSTSTDLPLLLIDDRLPYLVAILQVF